MGKHIRKRQKTSKPSLDDLQPLGSHSALTDDADKDDEERRLESLLFGVPFMPSRKEGRDLLVLSDDDEQTGDVKEPENMADTDVSQTLITTFN
jgi:U3 small nucleolar RNA-associated protein 18